MKQLSDSITLNICTTTCPFCRHSLNLHSHWNSDQKAWVAKIASCSNCLKIFYSTKDGFEVDEIGYHNLHLVA